MFFFSANIDFYNPVSITFLALNTSYFKHEYKEILQYKVSTFCTHSIITFVSLFSLLSKSYNKKFGRYSIKVIVKRIRFIAEILALFNFQVTKYNI